MIIWKGDHVSFDMAEDDASEIDLPVSAALLHDPDGEAFPKNVVLIGRFQRGRTVVEPTEDAKWYFGRDYDARQGLVDFPSLGSGWEEIGEVKRIYYERGGTFAPGYYHHDFMQRFVFKTAPVLSKKGRFYRLDLPRFCVANYRGFVFP